MRSADKTMKILMLNYEFPPLGGGAGNANYYLVKELARCPDLELDLITASAHNFRVERFAENITIHFLDIGKNNTGLHYQSNKDLLLYTLKAYLYAVKLQKQKKFDLCHAFFGIPCGFIALLLGIPYIVSLRGSDVPFYNKRFYWQDRLVLKHLSKIIWKNAKKVVANSEGLKELAQKTRPEQEIAVIYNGVDIDQFYPSEDKVVNDKIKLISTGRLIERKGYAYLLEALRDNSQVELILIGEGNQTGELKALAKKNNVQVKFQGRITHQQLPDYLRKADIFVLPSLNEGMSNSVLEAMACGLPVIATATGGSKELIKNNGFIVNKKSTKELKNAIDNYLNNKDLIKLHGTASRKLAESMDWAKIAQQYKEIYGNCSNHNAG